MHQARTCNFGYFLVLALMLLHYSLKAQGENECREGSLLIKRIKKDHIQPFESDSLWAESLFSEFLKALDPTQEYFTQKDIAHLQEFKYLLTEKKLASNCKFLSEIKELYTQNTTTRKAFTDSLLQLPIVYDNKIAVSAIQNRSPGFCTDISQLRVRWKNNLNEKVILQIIKMTKSNEDEINSTQIEKVEPESRKRVLEKELRSIEKTSNVSHIRNGFLKAIAQTFDPHTQFFPVGEINTFQSALDKINKSFGVYFSENQVGQIIVSRVIPAGPAWKSNMIHQGDLLINIRLDNGEIFESYDLDEIEVNELLSSLNDSVELKIKRLDGQVQIVSLNKEKIENADNAISSFILSGNRKIGYLALPAFYTDSEDAFEKGCTNDVAKELVKLKKEKIEGLILDLRFNGGGSMKEAIELSGIFIDFGPLALLQNADGSIITLKDFNRGFVYDGPLVIMVNGASASASELVAATLQDYNRAIIVGSTTYGKATAQTVYPHGVNDSDLNTSEAIKITTQKIYRPSGQSIQGQGVEVNIPLPDITEIMIQNEGANPNALINHRLTKKTYLSPAKEFDLNTVRSNSFTRVEQSEKFTKVAALRERLLKPIRLTIDSYSNFQDEVNSIYEIMSKPNDANQFKVSQNRFEEDVLKFSEYQKELSSKNINIIQNSFYIEEAYLILCDYLSQIER